MQTTKQPKKTKSNEELVAESIAEANKEFEAQFRLLITKELNKERDKLLKDALLLIAKNLEHQTRQANTAIGKAHELIETTNRTHTQYDQLLDAVKESTTQMGKLLKTVESQTKIMTTFLKKMESYSPSYVK